MGSNRGRSSRLGGALACCVVLLASCTGGGSSSNSPNKAEQTAAPQSAPVSETSDPSSPTTTASPEDSATANPTAEPAVPVGTAILTLAIDRSTVITMGGTTIAVLGPVDDEAGLRTYGLGGSLLETNLDPEFATPGCKMAVSRRSDGVDVLLTVQTKTTPAEGINPARTTRRLVASDAKTLKPLWDIAITRPIENLCMVDPSGSSNNPQDLLNTTYFTTDGKWVLSTASQVSEVISLSTGENRPVAGAYTTLGNYLLGRPLDNARTVYVIDPATGKRLNEADVSAPGGYDLILEAGYRNLAALSGTTFIAWDSGLDAHVTQVLTLPGLKKVWSSTSMRGVFSVFPDTKTGTLLAYVNGVSGYSAASGAARWSAKVDQVCGVWDGKVLVAANDQLATLDARSGKQLSFDQETTRCPEMLEGGYAYTQEAPYTSLVVTRVL